MATTAKMLGKEKEKEKAATKGKAATKATQKAAPKDFIKDTGKMCEALTKAKALNMIPKLVDEIESRFFTLGGVLSVVQINGFWEDALDKNGEQFKSFKDFMEETYGIHYRRGLYYVQIYEDLIESGVNWEDVKDIGWTKLKEISGLINPENVAEWRERAMSMTTIELIDYIRNLKAAETKGEKPATPDDTNKQSTMSFKVHEDQKKTITDALEKSMKANNTEYQTVALDYICMGYLEGKTGKLKKVEKTLDEVMKSHELEEICEAMDKVFGDEYDVTVSPKD